MKGNNDGIANTASAHLRSFRGVGVAIAGAVSDMTQTSMGVYTEVPRKTKRPALCEGRTLTIMTREPTALVAVVVARAAVSYFSWGFLIVFAHVSQHPARCAT